MNSEKTSLAITAMLLAAFLLQASVFFAAGYYISLAVNGGGL